MKRLRRRDVTRAPISIATQAMAAPVSPCGAESARDLGDAVCEPVGRRLDGIVGQVGISGGGVDPHTNPILITLESKLHLV